MLRIKLPQNHNDLVEASLLASMLRYPDCIDDIALKLRPEQMHRDAHQRIYRAILSVQSKKPVDLVTVAEELHRNGDLENVGGGAALAELYDSEPTGGHALHYAGIVYESHLRQSLSQIAGEMAEEAIRPTCSAPEALEHYEQQLWRLSELSVEGQAALLDADYDAIMDLSDARSSGEVGDELPTGFKDLDAIVGGLRPGQLIMIAARPSGGKTALGLAMARNISLGFGVPILFCSLEQSSRQIAGRNVSAVAQVNGHWINSGRLSREESARVVSGVSHLKSAKFHVDAESNQTCHRIGANARRMVRRFGVRALFVDYVQMVTPENPKAQRYEQVGEISRRLKGIAKELNIPVIAMAQLGRGADEVREPKLSDLRESGNLEADADVVIMLHREKEAGRDSNLIEAIIAKNRDGPQGRVTLYFRKEYVSFENYDETPFKG